MVENCACALNREYSRIRAIALCAIVVHPLKGSGTLRAEMPIHPFEVGSNLNELDCKYDKSLKLRVVSECLPAVRAQFEFTFAAIQPV